MIKCYKIVLLLMIMSGLCFAKSGLRFVEEDLSFGIEDSIFSVRGIYYFSSDHPGKYPILYPFPEDKKMGRAYDIVIRNIHTDEIIDYKFKTKRSFLTFSLDVDDDTPVYISYKQRLYDNFARYILLSTHSWKKPLERVEYKLDVMDNIKISYFSIEPDNEISLDFGRLYLWQRENYMPDRDLIFEFEER